MVAAFLAGTALAAAAVALRTGPGLGPASAAGAACFGAGVVFFTGAALAVVAFDAGVAERAAATLGRRVLTEPSTTTVMPASTSPRRIFLACAGLTAADSSVCATWADVSCPPAP